MKKYNLILLFTFLIIGLFYVNAQLDTGKYIDEKLTSFELFLGLDCDLGNSQLALQAMKKEPEKATAYLIAFFEKGIPAEARKNIEANFQELYKYRKGILESGAFNITLENEKKEMKSWTATTYPASSEFVKAKMQVFERNLQVRALEGLIALNTKTGNTFLDKLSSNPNFELATLLAEMRRG